MARRYVYSQNTIMYFKYANYILDINLANFVSLSWKLDNPICHNPHEFFQSFYVEKY